MSGIKNLINYLNPIHYVAKLRLIPRSIARSADHITRSDWHNWHADQCDPREDNAIQHDPRGDNTI